MSLNMPLMTNNINKQDLRVLSSFLKTNPILTSHKNVLKFEQAWSEWLGVKYSVFVNSGSSANLLSMSLLNEITSLSIKDQGEVIVPPLAWISNVVAVLKNNFKPVFADIKLTHLSMDEEEILKKINERTRAVFLCHIMGFNALSERLLKELERRKIPLIEDTCESIGATFNNKKLGTFGLLSNFSFYYGHHMTTVEGGMICTNEPEIYQMARILRGHGMLREATDPDLKQNYLRQFPDLTEDFTFVYPGYNFRNNEINAVLGLEQLQRLDDNNRERSERFHFFLQHLDPEKYYTDFNLEGSCNYALLIILRQPYLKLRDQVSTALKKNNVEFRRGISGGGNQLRQPYLQKFSLGNPTDFPVAEYVHQFGFYVGNYPGLTKKKISLLCKILNTLSFENSFE